MNGSGGVRQLKSRQSHEQYIFHLSFDIQFELAVYRVPTSVGP